MDPLDLTGETMPTTGPAHVRPDHRRVVAIDGPAAAGKTTVARALASQIGAMLFDTGLIYRAVTLAALRHDVSPDDGHALRNLALNLDLSILPFPDGSGRSTVLLAGEDVTDALRGPDVDTYVSAVSAHAGVRRALLPHQRRVAGQGKVVIVGRDIATVVVPDAGLKIFLEASLPERARRRYEESRSRGEPYALAEIEADLARRDAFDSSRAASPLRRADDSVVIDTDGKGIEAVVAEIAGIVHDRWSRLAENAA